MKLKVSEVIIGDLVLCTDENGEEYRVDPRIDFIGNDPPPIERFIGKVIEVDDLLAYHYVGMGVHFVEETPCTE